MKEEQLIHEEIRDRLLTAEQVAQYMQVPKSYIYKLTHQNRIQFIKIGGRGGKYIRFRQSEIDNWLMNSQNSYEKM